MITLKDNQAARLGTFSALYLAQGVPWGFIAVGYAVLLSDLGLDNTAIGTAMGLAYLPWSFKILWGPLLDAVPPLQVGRRRPFIIGAEAMMGITLLMLLPLDPATQLPLVSFMLFAHNTFASLQDVAVDALAVEMLQDDERGRANSLMWAGKSLGVALGGGGGTVLAKHIGYPGLFAVMAVAIWAIMLLPIFFREERPKAEDRPIDSSLLRLAWFLLPFVAVGAIMLALDRFEGAWVAIVKPFAAVFVALAAWPLVDRKGFGQMRDSFSFPTPWWGVIAAALTPAGYALVAAPTSRLLRVDLALSEEKIAFLSGVVDPIAGVVGALIGGVLADKLGARPAVGGLMGGIAACLLLFGLSEAWWPSYGFLLGFTVVQTLMITGYNTGTLGLFQGLSNPKIGATHFAVYMAATNLTYAWTAPLGGVIADRYGYPALYMLAAAVQVATIVLIARLDVARASEAYRSS